LKIFADRWGWEQVETDWKKMVWRDDVDIVDVNAPQYLHYEIAMEALRSGKHVFCEKPLALNFEQAKEMYELAENKGVTHYLNHDYFEIYGSKGSLCWNLERMNELLYFSEDDPACAQGFRDILATEGVHEYISHWWPPGQLIGCEHTFVHAVADFMDAIARKKSIEPNFYDGMKQMEVLDAGLRSAETGRTVTLA
jgi:predicted dehydrogenase